MPSDRALRRTVKELTERLDDLGSRLVGTEAIALQHGDRHTDLGGDAVIQDEIVAHGHPGVPVPAAAGNNTLPRTWIGG